MPIVSVQNVRRTYSQGALTVEALRGLDLEIEAGEFSAIMGPSGSGKTTLLNLIGGLDTPTSGKVLVDDQEVSAMTRTERSDLRRNRIGFIFQSYNLVPVLSAQENTEFVLMLQGVPAAERAERARQTLADVGLAGMEHRRPGELSGGQQQRVAVARAIASRPAIVLADEPTANLDSETKQELIELMRGLNADKGVTFLFSTHDADVIGAARRVISIRDGHVAADDRR
jgi:putative ABC transport system ATP-binding protein